MKKKIFLTAAIAAVMALSLAGCGVKVTDMAIPETATIEKGVMQQDRPCAARGNYPLVRNL